MNIFVAGVHGVGKTYLASRLPATLGLMHASASKLIQEELTIPNWAVDKRIGERDSNQNQIALSAAVKRHNCAGTRLLLDGHFVLLNARGEFSCLGTEVFESLKLDGVVLLQADPHTIAQRICERDGREADLSKMIAFISAERSQAQVVCHELGVSLHILNAPTPEVFADVVAAIASRENR